MELYPHLKNELKKIIILFQCLTHVEFVCSTFRLQPTLVTQKNYPKKTTFPQHLFSLYIPHC